MGRRLVAVVALAAAASATPEVASAQRTTPMDTTVRLAAGGTVQVELFSGDITVTGWDRDEVRVRGSRAGDWLRVEQAGSRVEVRASAGRRGGDGAVEITVPRGARTRLVTHSGELEVRGLRGTVDASVTNGGIEIADVDGEVSLATVTGDIRVSDLEGTIKAVAVNGNVTVRDASGEISATTTNGRVTLTDVTSRSVKTGSLNGTVEYRGTFDRAGTYAFHAHNGNITLYIPDGTGASLQIGTHSGQVESDLPLTLSEGRLRGHQTYTFTLGNGGATISAQSHTGNIFIRRAPRPDR